MIQYVSIIDPECEVLPHWTPDSRALDTECPGTNLPIFEGVVSIGLFFANIWVEGERYLLSVALTGQRRVLFHVEGGVPIPNLPLFKGGQFA